MQRLKKCNEKGFTLPELITTLTVSTLFIALILFFSISYWRYGLSLQDDQETLITRLNAQDFLREQLGTTSGLITQNGIPDTHTNNPDGSIPSNQYWTPIHAVPSTFNTGSGTTTPLLYYKRFSINSAGSFIMNGTQPYEDEYVLYLNNTTKELLVRSLANPNASGNKLLTSCPPAQASNTCPSDKIIANNLKSVSMRYFSKSGNPLDWTSSYDSNIGSYVGPDYPNVEVVELTLNISHKPLFQKSAVTQNSTVIRIALRNT